MSGLSVVGTRDPQFRCLGLTREWLLPLARVNPRLIVVSGFARGIDTAAHSAALEAELPTVAVIAGGLGYCYPKENHELREKILASGGLLLSESPMEETPAPHFFLQRNRIIAALGQATWVVQAGLPSGALSTASWAQKLGRKVYATPCCPGDPSFAGNQRLIDQGFATPAWGPHSFGETWLELATVEHWRRKPRASAAPAARLLWEIRRRSRSEQGASMQDLLDWAIAQGWSPVKFFSALQEVEKTAGLSAFGGAVRPIQGELFARVDHLRRARSERKILPSGPAPTLACEKTFEGVEIT
jgi:DNA protecting protein DprA